MKHDYLGDPHSGSSVSFVTINGHHFIEKTRNLKIDEVFSQFVYWCEEHGIPYSIVTPQLSVINGIKLISFVEHHELSTTDNAVQYYKRAGALLAICYMLGSTDMHDENLIANGNAPVLIDLETLLTPQVASFLRVKKPKKVLDDSVLHTGFLPNIKFSGDGCKQDVGGLSGDSYGDFSKTQNRPYDSRGDYPAQNYVDEICEGFSETYQWIVQNRDLILHESPYRDFADCTIRCILRQTQFYSNIINRLSLPDMLADCNKATAYLSKLANAFTKYADAERLPELLHIYKAEVSAIRQGKIPYFTAYSNALDLYDGFGKLLCTDYLSTSAFERTTAILTNMCETDLKFQTELIRANFHAAYPPIEKIFPLPQISNEYISLINAAIEIEEDIMHHRFSNGDWIAQCSPTEGVCGLKETNIALYSGVIGIALFEAALFVVTSESSYKNKSIELTDYVLKYIAASYQSNTLEKMSLGWANGIGGICYALCKVSELLSEPGYRNAGCKLCTLVTPDWVHHDQELDVLNGSAGLLIGMDCCQVDDSFIQLLADHIINHLELYHGHKLVYHPTEEKQPLTGMGHGASGIARALMVAWKHTGVDLYRKAALDMIAYEDECFSQNASNWPDYRYSTESQNRFMHGWCSGAPGIVLSRLQIKKQDPTLVFSKDIHAGVVWSDMHPTCAYDHLCCGNAGMIDLYLELGKNGNAQALAQQMITRKERTGKYTLLTFQGEFVTDVGMFSGLAGIGYEFLRVNCPDKIHSIL